MPRIYVFKNTKIRAGCILTLEIVLLTAWYGVNFKVNVISFKIQEYLFFEGIVCIPVIIHLLWLQVSFIVVVVIIAKLSLLKRWNFMLLQLNIKL